VPLNERRAIGGEVLPRRSHLKKPLPLLALNALSEESALFRVPPIL
jgi:hypothetical protein